MDPLDGTKEFIKRNGEFTVNIALVQDSVPVIGVIYVPVKRILYFAVEGVGAYKCSGLVGLEDNTVTLKQMIEDSERLPLDDPRDHFIVVASRSHLSPETEEYIAALRKKKRGGIELISRGSSMKICLVAEGEADVYPRFAPTMEMCIRDRGESIRVFPLSNWTELDIWQYIRLENIPIVPLYYAKERPVVQKMCIRDRYSEVPYFISYS